ncbi:hypothetical protein [Candidatus Methylacidithermus pantelleriae]|uniref:Uncharacterized protein n=1 Tax=Candidatus Methylacidithermus pantelleriae TaxID=2744239 RepID=A0A8J2BU01_9BACT|nr:hypothetical protein [Candidatus Methylacidithermus pantelleriae]CAF0700402.1 membrane hypothetical protein [Candidatus Methylacidithermus pantelleriae]
MGARLDRLISWSGFAGGFAIVVGAGFLSYTHVGHSYLWVILLAGTLCVAGVAFWLVRRAQYLRACILFALACWDLWVIEWLASVPRTGTALVLAVCSTTAAVLFALTRR